MASEIAITQSFHHMQKTFQQNPVSLPDKREKLGMEKTYHSIKKATCQKTYGQHRWCDVFMHGVKTASAV